MGETAARSGTWLAELSKLALNVRALALLLTLVWLPGAADAPIILACILALTGFTAVALLRWDAAAPRITRRPTLFAVDVTLAAVVLTIAGPESPFFLFALATAFLAGLLYGVPGALVFGGLLSVMYVAALDIRGAVAEEDFQQLFGLPVLHLVVAGAGAAVRRVFDRQTAVERTAAIERERTRMARDMHDSLAKTVNGMALGAAAVARRVKHDPDGAARAAEQLASDAEEAGREARGLIQGLRDGSAGRPLAGVVRSRAEVWGASAGVAVRIDVEDGVEAAPRARHELLCILDEALENVHRHAGASLVTVTLRHEDEDVVLVVRDDGCGFASDDVPAGHFGLVGMRERAAFAGGELTLGGGPGAGCCVTLRVRAARIVRPGQVPIEEALA